MHKLVKNGNFLEIAISWKEKNILTLFFVTIVNLSDPTFVPSLSEVGDLSRTAPCPVYSWTLS